MTIPNLITIMRLLLVPFIVVSISAQAWLAAFAMFIVAGASDGIDGYIARRFHMRSELGAYLDALADKAMLVSIYVALAIMEVFPDWVTILVVSRDVLILMAIAISWLMAQPLEIRPLIVSKLNTAAQISFAAFALGCLGIIGINPAEAVPWLFNAGIVTIVGLTVISAGAYLTLWLRHMTE